MTLYLVTEGSYEDTRIAFISTNINDAEEYATHACCNPPQEFDLLTLDAMWVSGPGIVVHYAVRRKETR